MTAVRPIFSVFRNEVRVYRGAALVSFDTTVTNHGKAWKPALSAFIAPAPGVYFFTLAFVREGYKESPPPAPIEGYDVYLKLKHNDKYVAEAWGGQGTGKRPAGVASVAIVLEAHDQIQVFACTDPDVSSPDWHTTFRNCSLTGFLISKKEE
jgi:hypothetical protein